MYFWEPGIQLKKSGGPFLIVKNGIEFCMIIYLENAQTPAEEK